MSTKMKNIMYFSAGILAVTFFIPLLKAMGLPPFDVVLTAMFGEGNPLALVFCAALIAAVLFVMNFIVRREARAE
ncbi:hypothetical protein KP77_34200 [Jeotgalibacillus alimentarius]|uniref:Uncharacterized protein n=1 Tax=Jeotgalibacillus alimentarius TaxID=135826 RepID=A0A0C2QXK2_9BACL|nr:hypothetical protein [Jeotgalibacillus alimentarius]KIL42790.1 hypothetical protein KP77_34200 [Jeotgalibacillus alimentarius]